jgi:sugar lactone lactonase YvrE
VGRAPQGLTLSADGRTLYVNNFMDRSVGVYDLRRC